MATDFSQSTRDCAVIRFQVRRADGWNCSHELRDGETVTVGSKEGSGVHLPGETVASIHCVLSLVKGELWVQDWHSSSGTCVHGELITEATCVPPGADIRVGEYTLITGSQQQADSANGEGHTNQDAPPAPLRACPADRKQEDPKQDHPNPPLMAEDQDDAPDTDARVRSIPNDDTLGLERELSEDWAVLRQPTLALEDDELNGTTPPDFADAFEQETTDLLRAEVEQLQCELAEREQELNDLRAENEGDRDPLELIEASEPSAAFVDRMEELLEELERSDERIAQLEQLLRCSEEATRAEHEERHQLEAWFSDIERRVSQREAEWKAEQGVLQERFAEMAQRSRRLEEQLRQSLPADNLSEGQGRELNRLREENEQLRLKLDNVEERLRQQASQHQLVANDGFTKRVQAEVDTRLREEHIQMAQERALLARQQAELVAMRSELERLSQPGPQKGCDVDTRVRVFREHLREIQVQEQRDLQNRSLSQRVAALWRRLDGSS